MHIRLINTDKPTGVVGFLPMEGGNEGGSGREIARPSVPVVTQVDEPVPGVQEELAEVDDLGSDVSVATGLIAQQVSGDIVSLSLVDYEKDFSVVEDTSSSDDEEADEEDMEVCKAASDIKNSLSDRYNAANSLEDGPYDNNPPRRKLCSNAYFNIATKFKIDVNSKDYQNAINGICFIPLEAAKKIVYIHQRNLALYGIAINLTVPVRFRCDAAEAMGDEEYDHYGEKGVNVLLSIAKDDSIEIADRIYALSAIINKEKNEGYITCETKAKISKAISERWSFQGNDNANWDLFDNLYRLVNDIDEVPCLEQPSEPTINEVQLSIIEIIINNTNLNKDFRIRVINEKLQGHHQQAQALDNISGGEKIELSLTPHWTKKALIITEEAITSNPYDRAIDSKIPWKVRLEAAQGIQDKEKQQDAYCALVTDPKLVIENADNPDEQEVKYIQIRSDIVKSIPEDLMRDNVLREIVRGWGADGTAKFSLNSFKPLYGLSSCDSMKKSLVDSIVKNKNLHLDFRQNVVVFFIEDRITRHGTFQSIDELGNYNGNSRWLNWLTTVINFVRTSSGPNSQRDESFELIVQAWTIGENESIDEHVKLFIKLYELVQDDDIKRKILEDILCNNTELPDNFHNAISDRIRERGDEKFLPNNEPKSARKI